MKREHTDIVICGGGVAGLTAAAGFGTAGFNVVLVDPAPPVTDGQSAGSDLRTTAFLQPARDVLEGAGLWARLAPEAMPLETMRIMDVAREVPVARDFDAADMGDAPFGWNFRNWVLRREMVARLDDLPNVSFRSGVGFKAMLPREAANIVTLSDATQVEAQLMIGADGRRSAVREAAGINSKTTRYGQKALSFAVVHEAPHNNVSTEVHLHGGPFTLVPLPDHEGQPCSAVVWMDEGRDTMRRAQMDVAAFEAEATLRSAEVYGPLRLVTGRQVWPIISQIAETMVGPRTALMAEAAHVMPPIGAQGLNTSLADLRCLLDLAAKSPQTLGSREMLAAYQRARLPDIKLRAAGIAMLNRTSQSGNPMLQGLRGAGMQLLHDAKPVRTAVMKLGLGAGR